MPWPPAIWKTMLSCLPLARGWRTLTWPEKFAPQPMSDDREPTSGSKVSSRTMPASWRWPHDGVQRTLDVRSGIREEPEPAEDEDDERSGLGSSAAICHCRPSLIFSV